jgi:VIT1/CCC1 family predicted Fe2+/Mn2+ transporter
MNKGVLERIDDLKNVLELKMNTFERDTRDSLSRIESQTTSTNGKIATQEKRITEQEIQARVASARINTIVIIFGFFIASVLIPLVAAFISAGKLW